MWAAVLNKLPPSVSYSEFPSALLFFSESELFVEDPELESESESDPLPDPDPELESSLLLSLEEELELTLRALFFELF
jgi:hypothetical protein